MPATLPPNGTRGTSIPKFVRPIAKVGMKVFHFMFGILGDRLKVQGQNLLELRTFGARTGKERQVIVTRFEDPQHPDAWLVAGTASGAARHPSWCYNLIKNPNQAWVKAGGQDEVKVHPELLEGPEREAAWEHIVERAPGFGKYETTTDRQIPVFRLTPSKGA